MYFFSLQSTGITDPGEKGSVILSDAQRSRRISNDLQLFLEE